MIKLLLTIGIIFLLIMLVVVKIRKKINSFFQTFTPRQEKVKDEKDEVVYSKDEIVVLKGESKSFKDGK